MSGRLFEEEAPFFSAQLELAAQEMIFRDFDQHHFETVRVAKSEPG